MLSKLLRHEFRATGRIMLPVYALLLVSCGGCTLFGRLLGRYPESTVLSVVQTVFATLFGVTTFGMLLLTLVLMVYRFYKNLMTDEGYLMFTLPVSRSQLIWSKLLVALVWSVLSTVLAALAWMAEISVVGRENVFSLIAQGLRSLRQHLSGNLTGCAAALVVLCLVSCLVSFLKFYAAISLGHSFSNHKVLLSVVFTSASASSPRPSGPFSPRWAFRSISTLTSGPTCRWCRCSAPWRGRRRGCPPCWGRRTTC